MPGYAATSNKVVQQSKPITSAKRVDNKDISKFKNKELKKTEIKISEEKKQLYINEYQRFKVVLEHASQGV